MRRDLIVKLLFVVAEPAQFLFFDNSLYFRDLLCYFLQSNSCTLSYCCNSLGHQAERKWIIPTLSTVLSRFGLYPCQLVSLGQTRLERHPLNWRLVIGDPTETRTHDFWLERPASCPIRRQSHLIIRFIIIPNILKEIQRSEFIRLNLSIKIIKHFLIPFLYLT